MQHHEASINPAHSNLPCFSQEHSVKEENDIILESEKETAFPWKTWLGLTLKNIFYKKNLCFKNLEHYTSDWKTGIPHLSAYRSMH